MSDKNKEKDIDMNMLFLGLTRPPMIMGVTMDFFGINIMFAICAFIWFNSLWAFAPSIPLHVIGVVGCSLDHNIFTIFFKKLECISSPNKKLWGCQSYEPY